MPSDRWQPSICTGVVSHTRDEDVAHRFAYRVWMALVNIDTPAAALGRRARRVLPDLPRFLSRADIEHRLPAGAPAPDRILLLTQPGAGVRFNPVSFYFCVRGDDLQAVVAEITNTPWDEQFCYVLPVADAVDTAVAETRRLWRFDKRFHVSPFMPMALRYHWTFDVADGRIRIVMRLTRRHGDGATQPEPGADPTIFTAALDLERHPITQRALIATVVRHPLQNLRTLARIYRQAFSLWRKGATFHAHPNKQPVVR